VIDMLDGSKQNRSGVAMMCSPNGHIRTNSAIVREMAWRHAEATAAQLTAEQRSRKARKARRAQEEEARGRKHPERLQRREAWSPLNSVAGDAVQYSRTLWRANAPNADFR
jgi:hypothetical protein